MKIVRLAALVVVLMNMQLAASLSCLYNSQDLRQRFDNKSWHPVGCNCPCEKGGYTILNDGTCEHCGHRRDARPFEIVRPAKTTSVQHVAKDSYKDQLVAFNKYIKNYGKKSAATKK